MSARLVSRDPAPALILASTSPYRRALLSRLGLPFSAEAPGVEERRVPGEAPDELVRRLARAKAEAVAARFPGAIVIGGDQVAELDGEVLSKPGSAAAALQQLERLAGRTHRLLTALVVLRPATGYRGEVLDVTELTMRPWSTAELRCYIEQDAPLDCAGSYRLERLGIALFAAWQGQDPSAVEGMPLMALTRLLGEAGLPVLGERG